MDFPTCLPDGSNLTVSVLEHFLEIDAATEIISVFQQCQSLLGKSLPRLEHVLDKTCNPMQGEQFQRAGNPKNILNIFSGNEPNDLHRQIAEYLQTHRTWCVTTNFDDCIEQASSFRIPVHVMDPQQENREILHSEYGTDWGIVKLHGTIEQGVENLAATLGQLQHGLPPAMKALLSQIMDEANVTVVAGYSGTDHFDVNHWIRARAGRRFQSRLIWISHKDQDEITRAHNNKKEPSISWNLAFRGSKIFEGRTQTILEKLLGSTEFDRKKKTFAKAELRSLLSELYTPTLSEKYLNGTRLAAAIGMGQLAEEQLRLFRATLRQKSAAANIEPDIYFARGMKKEALQEYNYLNKLNIRPELLTRTKALRHGGFRFQAVLQLLQRNTKLASEGAVASVEALASALDIIDDLQKFSLFRSRLARKFLSMIMSRLLKKILKENPEWSIAAQSKLDTQALRMDALLSDDNDGREIIRLCLLIADQYSASDFYTDKGPLVPGYYLTEKSNAQEEDRLADLVEINIDFASALLSAMRRRWPIGIESVSKEMSDDRHHVHADFLHGTTAAKLIFDLLFDSSRIATALQEQGLQISIARCWIKADKILKGVSYWKSQRLYLPNHDIDFTDIEEFSS